MLKPTNEGGGKLQNEHNQKNRCSFGRLQLKYLLLQRWRGLGMWLGILLHPKRSLQYIHSIEIYIYNCTEGEFLYTGLLYIYIYMLLLT